MDGHTALKIEDEFLKFPSYLSTWETNSGWAPEHEPNFQNGMIIQVGAQDNLQVQ